MAALALCLGAAVAPGALGATSQLSITYAADGRITSSPGAIDCGGRNRSCEETYATGTVVTLTAGSDTHAFAGWGGDCNGTDPVCELTMSADRLVSASFQPVSLDVTLVGYGKVTSSPIGISCPEVCTSDDPIGSTITLTATPDSNEQFLGWSGACSGTGSCEVALTESLAVTATFTRNTQFFDLVLVPPVGGAISSAPSGLLCGEGTRNDCQRSLSGGQRGSADSRPVERVRIRRLGR